MKHLKKNVSCFSRSAVLTHDAYFIEKINDSKIEEIPIRILKYPHKTIDFSLQYQKTWQQVKAYVHVNWGGNIYNRKPVK